MSLSKKKDYKLQAATHTQRNNHSSRLSSNDNFSYSFSGMNTIASRRAQLTTHENVLARKQVQAVCKKTTTRETVRLSTAQMTFNKIYKVSLHRKGRCYYHFTETDGIRANLRGRFGRRKHGLYKKRVRPLYKSGAYRESNSQYVFSRLSSELLSDEVSNNTHQNRQTAEPWSTFWSHMYLWLARLGFPTGLLTLCYKSFNIVVRNSS